ncbi:MAG TPA: hypothetical protein VMM81_03040 [Acidimicrobiia bacterium]|nr:hypothetical protein [Acidimicrobiia bacterium]
MRGVFALMASVALLVVSCSADGSHAYFEAVADINNRMEAGTFAALPRDAEPTWSAITAVVAVREAAVAELRALEPPESLEIEHEAYTTSLQVLVEESHRFLDGTADLDDAEFLAALVESADLEVLAGAVARACSALQAAATTAGLDTHVGC